MSKSNSVVFTACSVNYLCKAITLCRSVFDHNHGVDFVIIVADRKRPVVLNDSRIRLIWAEEIGYPEFLHCAFKYNIIELNTAVKPFFARMLLEEYEKVVYLDPDVYVFSSLDVIFDELNSNSVILTPHSLSPYEGDGRPNDQDLLRFGCFNLGFFAVNRSSSAHSLLMWWHHQCMNYCYYEPQAGLGVDQKWLDLVPAFFEDVLISKNPGLNVAFWNLHEREISRTEDARWLINGDHTLIFVHFSSFSAVDRTLVAEKQTRYEPGSRPDFMAVGDVYRTKIQSSTDLISVDNLDYGYSKFDDGTSISPTLRRFYSALREKCLNKNFDPFISTGELYSLACRNMLLTKNNAIVAHSNFKTINMYTKERKFISFGFRVMLKILGPDRYFSLMRYLSYYSSILNQADVIK